ncbi:MAG: DUF5009 domain-containing protein [Planctomycetota bacterium]
MQPAPEGPGAPGARGTEPARATRWISIDALRGFDMFWITGGAGFVAALAAATDWTALRWIEAQCEHVEWHGFRLWDLIFPLFLFLAGLSMPLSFAARRARGASERELHLHALRRGATLVALGVVYNGLLTFDWEHLRYASVLGRIGLAWMLAAFCVLRLSLRGQVAVAAGLLLGYWAALAWIPVPGVGAGHLEPGATLTDWFDRRFLPGRLHRTVRDPEGLLSTLPAVATALFGAFTGRWMAATKRDGRRLLGLVAAGLVALALGALWHLAFPINKNLWSSSFVLWTAGLSLLLVALFHLVVDVWGWRRLAFPLVVIGSNSILIYMLQGFVAFDALAELAFASAERRVHPALLAGGGVLLRWLFLYALYRRRLFLRV